MTNDSGLCTCDGINKGKKEAKRKMGIVFFSIEMADAKMWEEDLKEQRES